MQFYLRKRGFSLQFVKIDYDVKHKHEMFKKQAYAIGYLLSMNVNKRFLRHLFPEIDVLIES